MDRGTSCPKSLPSQRRRGTAAAAAVAAALRRQWNPRREDGPRRVSLRRMQYMEASGVVRRFIRRVHIIVLSGKEEVRKQT